jgi:hypothetical protein
LDAGDVDLPPHSRNVILPLNDLLTFVADNFSCRKCHKKLRVTDGETLASGLHFNCGNCAASASLHPDVVPEAQAKTAAAKAGHPFCKWN